MSESLLLPLSPKLQEYLTALVATGLYGTSIAEAAERLIAHAIEDKARGPMSGVIGRVLERR